MTILASDVDVNGQVSENYEIFHRVDRISEFKSTRVADSFNSDGTETEFLKLVVRNNTFDGFNVFLTPTNGLFKAENTFSGNTQSDTLQDGESDISYSIHISKISGVIGNGMSFGHNGTASGSSIAWNTSTVESGVSDPTALQVFYRSASNQTSATDCSVSIRLKLDADQLSRLNMAGRYSETIIVTYRDL